MGGAEPGDSTALRDENGAGAADSTSTHILRRMTSWTRGVALWAIVTVAVVSVGAQPDKSWDRFRGPNGSGVSAATNLPVEFGPTKNLLWKLALPQGHSSPILSGDRIYLTAFRGERSSRSRSIARRARSSGSARRRAVKTRVDRQAQQPGVASPAVEASGVYVFFPDYGLLAYDDDRQGALEAAARSVQQHLRHGRVAGDRRRHVAARGAIRAPVVRPGARQAHGQASAGDARGPKRRAATRRRSSGARRTARIRSCCPARSC